MDVIKLENEWKIVDRIGGGGFGEVYEVISGTRRAALKLVPKAPGAERELLLVDLEGASNIVPILEVGETEDSWAMLMPLAECSLRERVDSVGGVPRQEAVVVLTNICAALSSITERIVHRDIKPANILLLDGKWCLADFGIARYAEATTSADTRKYALSAPYAAPERWRYERATAATDIYSVGVVAYEILTGQLPFGGPEIEDYREQHLHAEPRRLESLPPSIMAIVDECLYKAPEARPSAANLLARFQHMLEASGSEGRSRLAAANLAEVRNRAESDLQRSQQMSEQERRSALYDAAKRSYSELSNVILDVIQAEAPSAQIESKRTSGWSAQLGSAGMTLSHITMTNANPWRWNPSPAFDVVAHGSLAVSRPRDRNGYEGRSHSLWFCDAQEAGSYAWYETGFMLGLVRRTTTMIPFDLEPGEESAKALGPAMTEYEVAWPFERLERGAFEHFVDRWMGYFADAATGQLNRPSGLPERDPRGSWRDN